MKGDELPEVSVLIPAYNEEQVIAEKMISVFANNFPQEKLEVIVGSDGSSDRTNEIVKSFQHKFSKLKLIEMPGRSGKASVMNQLVGNAKGEIIIITDANVMPDSNCIMELVKHFKNPEIGLVDSNMQHKGMRKEGIAMQEKSYIRIEVRIKNLEGKLWGTMIGPFGGCFALRKKLYVNIPPNTLVDDFYVCMKVLEQKSKAINEPEALVFEDVSNKISEEFRRKVRIATGNFQNMYTFFRFLFRFNGLAFSFLSHKVLRWLGPLFMIVLYICNIFLLSENDFYFWFFIFTNLIILLPVFDFILKKINIHSYILRMATHFFSTNLALLIGMFRFMGGVKSGVWNPTERNQ